ncbi:MAG TPA: ATP-binding protein [candidate division Zixibacteria bacterium]|nr:hypothetical protein [candidate division Zixibacteria bacterium]MDD4917292.1 ATP-binding protein [candidate division Zixibacteria bacterium]MDM7971560.1 ATP-binding protein [candidate division Zixibacteria bacterium]HOD65446.1 ATP-binding protein [candidate division Zixibacteria bacterium]HPM36778.1 ATP-binding protein [candidate division Zixibacteria bacterium]
MFDGTIDKTHADLYKVLFDLRGTLRDYGEPRKMLIYGMRRAVEFLAADAGAVATLSASAHTADLLFTTRTSTEWNVGLLNDFIKRREPRIPDDVVLARVERRAATWGAIAVRLPHPKEAFHLRALGLIAEAVREGIAQYDDRQIRRLRHRLEQKVVNRREPKDIIYLILHGIRSLTRYDHSATFLATNGPDGPLQIIAEQIAWTKAKSRRIGLTVPLAAELRDELSRGGIHLHRQGGHGWQPVFGAVRTPGLIPALCCTCPRGASAPEENAVLCAVIPAPDGSLGILKIAFQRADIPGAYEIELVENFTPLLSLALQFHHRTEVLTEQVVQAERKSALADLSRGIAHDVNNAIGSVLPLAQQIRADIARGELDQRELLADLDVIESGMLACRRIFAGLLSVARSGDRTIGEANLRRAVDGALNVVRSRLDRHSIAVELNIPPELSAIGANQGHITQVFLNLFANSIEAMPHGGRLAVSAVEKGPEIEARVEDSGGGIPPDLLDRVADAFITTKESGHGLGLAVCRGILWNIGGELRIDSTVGQGTCVTLRLPTQSSRRQERLP